MPSPQSPRIDEEQQRKCKLHSTHKTDGSSPRKLQSVYQAVATSRGYTVKAGAATRARLHRGIPVYVEPAKADLEPLVDNPTMRT